MPNQPQRRVRHSIHAFRVPGTSRSADSVWHPAGAVAVGERRTRPNPVYSVSSAEGGPCGEIRKGLGSGFDSGNGRTGSVWGIATEPVLSFRSTGKRQLELGKREVSHNARKMACRRCPVQSGEICVVPWNEARFVFGVAGGTSALAPVRMLQARIVA